MRIAVLGTGMVGKQIASRLVELGHDVTMGSRSAGNEDAVGWADAHGDRAHAATFASAASSSELVFNCVKGEATLHALELVGAEGLAGKVLVDVSNPLDFSQGFPPTLLVKDTDSLGEQVQREYPDARVVKALNTMNCTIMVHPELVPGHHTAFMAGNDEAAKATVRDLLTSFGWADADVLDLGDITASRGLEMYLPLWLRIMGARGNGTFNLSVVGAGS